MSRKKESEISENRKQKFARVMSACPELHQLSADHIKEYKELAASCAEICRTEIGITQGDGWERVSACVTEDEMRSQCVAVYDVLVPYIREHDRMYMPPAIERTMPDRDRLLFLQRQYLAEQNRAAIAMQSAGNQFNSLLGGRNRG